MLKSILAAVAMGGLVGCGGQSGPVDGPLVRVGEVDIDVLEVREYHESLPDYLKPTGEGEVAVRDLLESLVVRQVLIMEAEALGLSADADVREQAQRAAVRRLTEALSQAEISGRVQVTEEELREAYERDHWNQAHRPGHILTATEEEAWEVVGALKRGVDFAELARERSLAPDAYRGGDLGRYFGPGDMVPELGGVVLGLGVGEFSNPVRTLDGWEVVQILEVREMPYEAVQGNLARLLRRKVFMEERGRYVRELEQKYGVAYHAAGIRALLAGGDEPADPPVIVLSYQDHPGILLGSEALKAAFRGVPRELVTDSASVVGVLRDRLLPDSLMVLEARRRGLDQDPGFVRSVRRTYEKALVNALRRSRVLSTIEVSDEEIRQRYEREKAGYRVSGVIEVSEILVATEAEAEDLLLRIRSGADMSQLAWEHSRRAGAKETEGAWQVAYADPGAWGDLHERFRQAVVGAVSDPVAVPEGFSIFRVDRREEPHERSLEEVKELVAHRVRRDKSEQAFQAYAAAVRARYADRIVWLDDRIAAVAAAGGW